MAQYNHMFEIAFEIGGSSAQDGSDITAARLREAIQRRVQNLCDEELLEAVGAPSDTFEEENSAKPLSEEEQRAFDRLVQGFMSPEIIGPKDALVLETRHGTVVLAVADMPGAAEAIKDKEVLTAGEMAERLEVTVERLCEDTGVDGILELERRNDQFLARLSASGYLDASDFTCHESLVDAQRYLVETHEGENPAPDSDSGMSL